MMRKVGGLGRLFSERQNTRSVAHGFYDKMRRGSKPAGWPDPTQAFFIATNAVQEVTGAPREAVERFLASLHGHRLAEDILDARD